MRRFALVLSATFAAGALGGLANALVVWWFGHAGWSALVGVHIAPHLSRFFVYQRLVWGGIWGAMFVIPVAPKRWALRGAILSLAPSAVTLLVLMPHAGARLFGLAHGPLTPALVLLFNLVWGLVASGWLAFTHAPAAS